MFVLDMPNMPPQAPMVMVAQNSQKPIADTRKRSIGICMVVGKVTGPLSFEHGLGVGADAGNYLAVYEKDKRSFDDKAAKITFLQLPEHGKVINEIGDTHKVYKGGNYYSYIPNAGYSGKDKIIALVEMGGYKVKVVYFLHVVDATDGDLFTDDYCKKGYWKISSSGFAQRVATNS